MRKDSELRLENEYYILVRSCLFIQSFTKQSVVLTSIPGAFQDVQVWHISI